MTTLPDWMVRYGEGLTAADYEALPEEICRRIEIVDGAVMVRPSPWRPHQQITRSLVNAMEVVGSDQFAAVGGVDLRLRDMPLLNRIPDVVVYEASLPNEEILRPEQCLLVVEVMSPDSVTADQIDKPAEYAAFGIRHFWRVEYDDQTVSVFRYELHPRTRTYALGGLDRGRLSIKDPVELELDLEELR
jgi:Uma2 family endonuclease